MQQPGDHARTATPVTASPSSARLDSGADAKSTGVLLAVDKFKGTLDADTVCRHLAEGFRRVRPEFPIRTLPVADGGDGAVAAALRAGFASRVSRVTDAAGRPVDARCAIDGRRAVIEVAEVCGLRGAAADDQTPLAATSYGVGQLISTVLDLGCTTVVLGLGGTATVDGGVGMLTALGAVFRDHDGLPLEPGGGALAGLATVELSTIDPRVKDTAFVLAADVDNPLLGADGAASIYGPQKGAGPSEVSRLEDGLRRLVACLPLWAEPLARSAGAGAAGGLGFAGLLLGGVVRGGADFFLDLLGFDDALAGSALVVTGEGRLDHQTLHGKAPARVAERASGAGVPVIAVVGSCVLAPDEFHAAGIRDVVSLSDIDARCATDPHLTARLLADVGACLAALPHRRSDATSPAAPTREA
jgi:glycerate kinase